MIGKLISTTSAVVLLLVLSAGQSSAKEWSDPTTGMVFVWIPGGSFMMGSNEYSSEKPIHRVSLKGFWMGKYEVTQDEWKRVMGSNPSNFKGGRNPVEQVSWNDVQKFISKLNSMGAAKFSLLSEAQWEFAARGGTTTKYWWGDSVGRNNANCDGCGSRWDNKSTAPVGSFKPNRYGLHDMSGNVWEWCADKWHDNYSGAPSDGSAWTSGGSANRVMMRGGSWFSGPRGVRSANRGGVSPGFRSNDLGFRLLRTN